jgi:hypothetical protein
MTRIGWASISPTKNVNIFLFENASTGLFSMILRGSNFYPIVISYVIELSLSQEIKWFVVTIALIILGGVKDDIFQALRIT